MGRTEISITDLNARGLKIAVLAARYNPKIMDGLLSGALAELKRLGLDESEVAVLRVPGAFELPLVAARVAAAGKLDAVVCLGAVVRGDTSHFDYVCQGATQGLQQAMLQTGVPMAFGVLTVDTEAQALARSGEDEHNKGAEAVRAAVETARLLEKARA